MSIITKAKEADQKMEENLVLGKKDVWWGQHQEQTDCDFAVPNKDSELKLKVCFIDYGAYVAHLHRNYCPWNKRGAKLCKRYIKKEE